MNEEEARQKEAERTLKRIKGTLHHLEDGSAWEDPLSSNKEFQRMKRLIESGYSHQRNSPVSRLLSWIRSPLAVILLIVLLLIFAMAIKAIS
jgi:hypothetical protein